MPRLHLWLVFIFMVKWVNQWGAIKGLKSLLADNRNYVICLGGGGGNVFENVFEKTFSRTFSETFSGGKTLSKTCSKTFVDVGCAQLDMVVQLCMAAGREILNVSRIIRPQTSMWCLVFRNYEENSQQWLRLMMNGLNRSSAATNRLPADECPTKICILPSFARVENLEVRYHTFVFKKSVRIEYLARSVGRDLTAERTLIAATSAT